MQRYYIAMLRFIEEKFVTQHGDAEQIDEHWYYSVLFSIILYYISNKNVNSMSVINQTFN